VFGVVMRYLLCLLVLTVVGISVAVLWLVSDYQRFLSSPVVVTTSQLQLTVKSGDTLSGLMQTMQKNRLVLASQSPFAPLLGEYYLRYLAKVNGQASQLKAGKYQLKVGMTAPQLLNLLVSGKVITEKIRFLEGWNIKRLRQAIADNSLLAKTLEYVPDDQLLKALSLSQQQSASAEGLFFPDTYTFINGEKDSEVLKRAYRLMQQKLKESWQQRDTSIPIKTPYELLIVASLIEKETSKSSERAKIAGVFYNRLHKGMLLQTDPAVIYGLGSAYQGKLYKKDLQTDTPYNTYTRRGLPPTPIALPGLASIEAASRPAPTRALYFVADGKGGHVFSTTYKNHLKAVSAYRQWLRAKSKKSKQQTKPPPKHSHDG